MSEEKITQIIRNRRNLLERHNQELPPGFSVMLCTSKTTQNVYDWGLWFWSGPNDCDGYEVTEAEARAACRGCWEAVALGEEREHPEYQKAVLEASTLKLKQEDSCTAEEVLAWMKNPDE